MKTMLFNIEGSPGAIKIVPGTAFEIQCDSYLISSSQTTLTLIQHRTPSGPDFNVILTFFIVFWYRIGPNTIYLRMPQIT